ncbi:MAG TPA: hypothetical protein P5137_14045 [Candidatus Brocadiia bacterium]|nr:hypothetical protein [Candidatus Brocadiia bacterium]
MKNAELKKLALACGADLAGVAPIERFSALAPEMNPRFIQPAAKSVVVVAYRIPRGALRGVEANTAWHTMGAGMPTSVAIESTYFLCRELESLGWEAAPLFDHSANLRNRGVKTGPDKPEPDVIIDMEFAAQAAGLGHVGMGKLFLTPEFGPRQIFCAVVTDAEIEPDPVFAGAVCDGCGECVKACPALALGEEWQEAEVCGTKARWRKLRQESCRVCATGPVARPYSATFDPIRIAAACGRACVAHLEDAGRLKRKFRNSYRPEAKGVGA